MKACSNCTETKADTEFHRNGRGYLNPYCKRCQSEMTSEQRRKRRALLADQPSGFLPALQSWCLRP